MSKWLLLYPRSWRERYGDEISELIASEPPSLRQWLDLIAGAIDARTNPEWAPVAQPEGGHETMGTFLRSCGRQGLTPAEQRLSAFLMLGTSLAMVMAHSALRHGFGESPWLDAFLYAAFNIALCVSSWPTFLRNYPTPVRSSLVAAGVLASYGFFAAVTVLTA